MKPCSPDEHNFQEVFSGNRRYSSAVVSISWCNACGALKEHTMYTEICRSHVDVFVPLYEVQE